MGARRGFTLIELFVVITIITAIMMVVALWASSYRSGPPLDIAGSSIASLVARIRQVSATQRVHGELVLDYKNDRVVALSRRRHFTFAFEEAPGAAQVQGGLSIFGDLKGEPPARLVKSRQFMLRDGGCLELTSENSRFIVPWLQQFETDSSGYEGVALSFDFFPMGESSGAICAFGSVFTLAVKDFGNGAVRLQLGSGAELVISQSLLSLYRWATVELAISRYSVRLYVDGRLSASVIKDENFRVPLGGSPLEFAGYVCRVDNVQLYSLVSSQVLELGQGARGQSGVQLVPDDVDPQLELNGGAESIYIGDEDADADPRSTSAKPDSGVLTGEGLPAFRPPPIQTVYFDSTGKLDPSLHAGGYIIRLIARGNDGKPERMEVLVHALGTVTLHRVESFPWENHPAQQPAQPEAPAPVPEDGE